MTKDPAAVSLGKRGGEAVRKKYGTSYFQKMAQRSAIVRKKKAEAKMAIDKQAGA